MNFRSILAVFAFILFMAACSSETDNPYTQPSAKPANGLALNKGAKWQADEATTQNVQTMKATLARFSGKTTKSDLNALGRELRSDLNKTFRDCTMTGAAHDMLHKFLIPVEKQIEVLEGEDAEAAIIARIRLEEHVSTYSDYFE